MTNSRKVNNDFYNIHSIINANATKTTDGKGWIYWANERRKEGLKNRNLNLIADIITGA